LKTNGLPGEATVVFVREGFDFQGAFEHTGEPEDLLFGVFGSAPVSVERALDGTFVVPNAHLRLAPAHKQFTGSLFARSLDTDADLTVTLAPFRHWEEVFRPREDIIDPIGPSRPSAAALARQVPDEPSFVRTIPFSEVNTVPGAAAAAATFSPPTV